MPRHVSLRGCAWLRARPPAPVAQGWRLGALGAASSPGGRHNEAPPQPFCPQTPSGLMRVSRGPCSRRAIPVMVASNNVTRRFSEIHLCGAKELLARPRKFFRISPPLSIETLRKSAENPVFWARVSFFPQDCVFSPKVGHFAWLAWLASSFSRRSTIDRSCIARRLDVRLTNGRRRMPSLVVGGGVRARKPPSAPSSAC